MSLEFDPKNMPFRRLGPSGLRVPIFCLGGWLTLGGTVTGDPVKEIIKVAFENGINMFDTAEAYAKGRSELEMGRVIKELGLRRNDLIITTKLFWGLKDGPNDTGLSRKHIIEGTKDCLERLQLDYVDVIFAHRPDASGELFPTFDLTLESMLISHFSAHGRNSSGFQLGHRKGMGSFDKLFLRRFLTNAQQAFYWATSEWSAQEIEAAHRTSLVKLGGFINDPV